MAELQIEISFGALFLLGVIAFLVYLLWRHGVFR
jgi:hypothetical protein